MPNMLTADKRLSGVERAAILMLACGDEYAAEVIKYLEPGEMLKLVKALAVVERPGRGSIGRVLNEFCDEAARQEELGLSSKEYLHSMLIEAMQENHASNLVDRIQPGWQLKGLETLKWMEPRAIADLLRLEHPQVIAVVLACLEQEQSAEILAALPHSQQVDIVMRIASLDGIRPVALQEIDETLTGLLRDNSQNLRSCSAGGLKSAASIMNYLDGKLEAEIIAKIRTIDNELGIGIQDLKFEFSNLIDLDDRVIQTLLREVSSETIRIALRGSDDAIRDKILMNMSRRASEMLIDDLQALGPVRAGEVKNAQKEILDIVWRMVETGEISLSGGAEAYI